MKVKKPVTPKRKSKGKQHPLHAESLDQMAQKLRLKGGFLWVAIAEVFEQEAERVRSIVR